jgi:hypothetical protein
MYVHVPSNVAFRQQIHSSLFLLPIKQVRLYAATRGARFFLGKIYQNEKKNTKWPLNIPKGRKIYMQNIGRKIFQMSGNYTNIFHSKAPKNIPKFVFLLSGNPGRVKRRKLMRTESTPSCGMTCDVTMCGVGQGCQMVYFQTKNPNLGIFWRDLNIEDVGLFYGPLGLFYCNLVYILAFWYIL